MLKNNFPQTILRKGRLTAIKRSLGFLRGLPLRRRGCGATKCDAGGRLSPLILEVMMSIQKLAIFVIVSLVCSLSINAQTEKKSAYKKFVEVFDKATTKLEEEAPKKIEKGMEILTDNLEDFENDIHAEPKKQSKFAKIFNYIADIDITETPGVGVDVDPEYIEKVGAYTDSRDEP